ncbi:MAG: hydrogenase small subunit [Nitrospirota bacterium]
MGEGNILGKELLKELELCGLNRRDFLKYCSLTAAILGLSELEFVTKVAEALESPSKKPIVIWIEGQACAGCTIALAQISYPSAASIILDKISLRYHHTIMAAAGDVAEKAYHDAVKQGGYLLVVEGSIPSADDRFHMGGGMPFRQRLEESAKNSNAILAVGACSAFGGIPRATPSKGISVSEALKRAGITKPVVNISTCPVHPDHLAGTILYVLVTGKIPELDSKGRPSMYFGDARLLHDNCRRRGHFDAGEFLTDWNDPKQKDWCLFQKGCKGPVAYIDCGIRRWNDGINFCLDCGGLCQACGDPVFYDKVAPLYTAESEISKKIWAMREDTKSKKDQV